QRAAREQAFGKRRVSCRILASRSGGMADAADSKSVRRNAVKVRLISPAPICCSESDEEFTHEEASDGTRRVTRTVGREFCRPEREYLHRRNLGPLLYEGKFPRNDDEATQLPDYKAMYS